LMQSLMRAVSRATDYTLLVMNIDAEFDEGCQQSRRLHPDDNEDGGEGGRDTERVISRAADCTLYHPFIDALLKMMLRARVLMFTRMMGKESISWGP